MLGQTSTNGPRGRPTRKIHEGLKAERAEQLAQERAEIGIDALTGGAKAAASR